MPSADERERRFVEYLLTRNRGQLAEFKLTRLNRIANFRKRLMALLNEMIEVRAEDLAAGMLMAYAPPRPVRLEPDARQRRLPFPERKRKKPVWLHDSELGRVRRRE